MSRVYITGVGCITPLGNDIATLWNNLVNGVCGIDFITKIDTADLPVKVAAGRLSHLCLCSCHRSWCPV